MDRGGLIRKLRTERLDDAVAPYLYSDELLTGHLNDAIRQAALRRRLLLDRRTPECCTASVAAGTDDVPLHPRVLAVRTARWGAEQAPLVLTTLRRMDAADAGWPTTPAGVPSHLIVDAQTGAVTLWPIPAAPDTLHLAVWRVPLETEELEGDSDEPVIDEPFHVDLLDWAEYLCYLPRDGEAGDPDRAGRALARFEAKFGRLPSATEIRGWGLSPPRRTRTHWA